MNLNEKKGNQEIEDSRKSIEDSRKSNDGIEYIFHPRSVAVAGVSNKPFTMGQLLLSPFLKCGFKGNIYPLNPNGGKIWGMKIYSSLKEIPGEIDYVVLSIPAPLTPQFMEDCVAKGVKVVSIFSAGFSESAGAEGSMIEARIVEIARRGEIRIIGPNCWGIYYPKEGLSFCSDFSAEAGCVGFIGQSGGNSAYMVRSGYARGVRFSKVISYGNACDLNESDFLEYFAHDPETKIIAAYIEGVRDGRRFLKVLGKASRVKPVVLIKGGKKGAGAVAAASHTGALVSSETIWDTLFKQTGVVGVDSVDEMVDAVLAFLKMPVPMGRNAAIIGGGGGVTVLAADVCERAGLNVPLFSSALRNSLQEFFPPVGTILKNPVDTQWILSITPEQLSNIINLVAGWEEIDVLIVHYAIDIGPLLFHEIDSKPLDALIDSLI
jgi:acyl-CoA synthetase (NDP forming)